MFELLGHINYWHWLAFGFLLLAAEVLGCGGYLLMAGIAAIFTSIIMMFLPVAWQLQWVIFAFAIVVTTWLWWRYQHSKDQQHDKKSILNKRTTALIGRKATLLEDTINERSTIRLDDVLWEVCCDQHLPQGTQVTVIEASNMHLQVKSCL